jgi:hypothetical protein
MRSVLFKLATINENFDKKKKKRKRNDRTTLGILGCSYKTEDEPNY